MIFPPSILFGKRPTAKQLRAWRRRRKDPWNPRLAPRHPLRRREDKLGRF